jgi:hypothetical protein
LYCTVLSKCKQTIYQEALAFARVTTHMKQNNNTSEHSPPTDNSSQTEGAKLVFLSGYFRKKKLRVRDKWAANALPE